MTNKQNKANGSFVCFATFRLVSASSVFNSYSAGHRRKPADRSVFEYLDVCVCDFFAFVFVCLSGHCFVCLFFYFFVCLFVRLLIYILFVCLLFARLFVVYMFCLLVGREVGVLIGELVCSFEFACVSTCSITLARGRVWFISVY